jgi:hypothetical protein
MEDTLVIFETAKLAKEKGYPQTTGKMFDNGKLKKVSISLGHPSDYKDRFYSAPTQSLLQKWLREVHDIQVNPNHTYTKSNICLGYNLSIESGKYNYLGKYIYGDSYEDVLEAGLQEALKLIK